MFVILVLICATVAAAAFGRASTAPLVLAFVAIAACSSPGQVAPPEPSAERIPEPGPALSSASADASLRTHPPGSADKHLVFGDDLDGGFAPVDHTELLWGDYIDKQGKPAVGWHSHDPVTGNAK